MYFQLRNHATPLHVKMRQSVKIKEVHLLAHVSVVTKEKHAKVLVLTRS